MSDRSGSRRDPTDRDSHAPAAPSSPQVTLPSATELRQKLFWSVPETAFMTSVSVRTVWRLMADPKSGFPEPRRVRGRTLLVAAEVLQFMQEGTVR